MTPTAFRRMQRGRGAVAVERLPYVVDAGLQALAEVQQLVLLGAPQPVAFFAYPGKPSTLAPAGCAIHTACSPEEDVLLALQALATALGVDRKAPLAVQAAGHIHAPTSGPLTASAVNLVALQACRKAPSWWMNPSPPAATLRRTTCRPCPTTGW
jgi:acetolactate synthase-1/2/3 large subunit